jgi:MoaA/NifB/PqqE/SkfB family radical SAM enzyme/ubiquinone/menaquinone biosynthesis C-methylase UbiE
MGVYLNTDQYYNWIRLEQDNTAVYVNPESVDWIVPSAAGDRLLQKHMSHNQPIGTKSKLGATLGPGHTDCSTIIRESQFLSLLKSPDTADYEGRAHALSLKALKEFWLHITDQCNLACRHCLFSCSSKTSRAMDFDMITSAVRQAYGLGTRIFYLTGGEPLVHPDFQKICRLILNEYPDTMLVILTNGVRIPDHLDFFNTLPCERLFLQVSLDGLEETNDRLRGSGAFAKTAAALGALKESNIITTLSMVVHPDNFHQITKMVELAVEFSVNAVHYMWLLTTGRASTQSAVPMDELFNYLIEAHNMAEAHGLSIDNITNLAARVFSTPGTKYDLGNAGWESLALDPDGMIYPTPALIGRKETVCGHVSQGLETVWRSSDALETLRSLSVKDDPVYGDNPLKYIVGGPDIDHSFHTGGSYLGHDPYLPLYSRLALWLMVQSAQIIREAPWPQIRRKMGEKLLHCEKEGESVSLTHSNCVLTLADTHGVVGDFYSAAAQQENTDITNPVCYPDSEMSHIPKSARIRSYGCGSPVLDAGISLGDTVVDLGCGAGVECYIAAQKTGPSGQVFGIDMLDHMLALARKSLGDVTRNLGYSNVFFKKGFLEQLPLAENTVDLVISNCVINLSQDKRQTFAEIFRILAPGGRIFISDVVTDEPCPPEIQNDAVLRGACLSGALVQPQLMSILESAGFSRIRVVKRFFYKEVLNHKFYAVTYTAFRPKAAQKNMILYPDPHAAVITDDGQLLLRGQSSESVRPSDAGEDTTIFELDHMGSVSNIEAMNSCSCELPPTPVEENTDTLSQPAAQFPETGDRFQHDCMLCGQPLVYLEEQRQEHCVFCGKQYPANAVCEQGHFVCDQCHGKDMVDVVKHICTHTDTTDMIDLINQLRSHPSFPLHGPEHHFAVPGVITAVYRNLGGDITDKDIITAIDRGRSVPGGVCAFWGTCGAAVGAGIAFGIILKSTPLKPKARQIVQKMADAVIRDLNGIEAARCCQREVWTTFKTVARLSKIYLPLALTADGEVQCRQQGKNRECIRETCPYFKV